MKPPKSSIVETLFRAVTVAVGFALLAGYGAKVFLGGLGETIVMLIGGAIGIIVFISNENRRRKERRRLIREYRKLHLTTLEEHD